MTAHYNALYAMGTRLEIVLPGISERQFQSVFSSIKQEVNRIENSLTIFTSTSFIRHLNTHASEKSVPVNKEIWSLVTKCLELTRRTNGAFDITTTPVEDLRRNKQNSSGDWNSLSKDEVVEKLNHIGSEVIRLYKNDHSIKFIRSGVKLDFGAVGKGYALDRIRAILNRSGVKNAFINFGESTIYTRGEHPAGSPWTIEIPPPEFTPGESSVAISLDEMFLSTSASIRSDRQTDMHQPHILDPRSGEPMSERRQVSVTSSTGLEAEALSTAMVVLSKDERDSVIHRFPYSTIVKIFTSHSNNSIAETSREQLRG
ncbi:MAG: FAD:protein FMN transferase [Candidatus Marinimicrobia bacterium]|nr:FAD:protein FMN transferase [Candidatus Neomarinimicrobiota bacterium]MCF7880636.1 FAD:protein FMN transferase [Candidatus Neomarinimicrobiota bacterium]